MKKNDIYTFKPLSFENFSPDFFDNDFNNYDYNRQPCNFCCPKRNCTNCKPNRPYPPNNVCPPQMPPKCPQPPFPIDCSKDNFRYFLLGYLFGSWY